MAFNQANFNCIANGKMGNVFTYHTADNVVTPCSASSSVAVSIGYFNTTLVPKLSVGDRILCSHTGTASASTLLQIIITKATSAGVSAVFSV